VDIENRFFRLGKTVKRNRAESDTDHSAIRACIRTQASVTHQFQVKNAGFKLLREGGVFQVLMAMHPFHQRLIVDKFITNH
jgi:hypothetical protein